MGRTCNPRSSIALSTHGRNGIVRVNFPKPHLMDSSQIVPALKSSWSPGPAKPLPPTGQVCPGHFGTKLLFGCQSGVSFHVGLEIVQGGVKIRSYIKDGPFPFSRLSRFCGEDLRIWQQAGHRLIIFGNYYLFAWRKLMDEVEEIGLGFLDRDSCHFQSSRRGYCITPSAQLTSNLPMFPNLFRNCQSRTMSRTFVSLRSISGWGFALRRNLPRAPLKSEIVSRHFAL
jgi:hypothetical protein